MLQFLNPFLLWGLAAASVPIIIHLLNRRRYRRQRWAAMEWLLVAVKQQQRRLRMESLLLLLLRTLAILLLALALARPLWDAAPVTLGDSRQTHLFLVVDNSGSVSARSGLSTAFEEVTTTAASLLGKIGSDDPVTLVVTNDNVTADRANGRPRVVVRESRDHAKLRRLLAELRPAPVRADLAETLKTLDEAVPTAGGLQKRVAVITDMQRVTIDGLNTPGAGASEGETENADALRDQLQNLAQKEARVFFMPAGRQSENVGIVGLRPEEARDVVQGSRAAFIADIVNYSNRPARVEVRILVDGEERGDVVEWIDLPPRPAGFATPPSRPRRFEVEFDDTEVGSHTIEARIPADPFPLDDARAYAFDVRPRLQILAIDGDPNPVNTPSGMAETRRLREALGLRDDGPFNVTLGDETDYRAARSFDQWDMLVLANVRRPAPDEETYKRLEQFVSRGGALFLTVGDQVVAETWNNELWRDGDGLLPARLGNVNLQDEDWLRIDLSENQHPILRDITNPANAAFFQSPFLRGFMRLDEVDVAERATVVARFKDLQRSPALVERRKGTGSVLLLTTTLDDAWGDLPNAHLFPALLHEIAYVMTARGSSDLNLLTFQPYARTFESNFDAFEVRYPDGSPATANVESPPDAPAYVLFGGTDRTGVYSTLVTFKPKDLLSAAPPAEPGVFAVAMSPFESDLERVPNDEFERRYEGLAEIEEDLGLASDVLSAGQGNLARSLLLLALICLVAEVGLARHIGRRRLRT